MDLHKVKEETEEHIGEGKTVVISEFSSTQVESSGTLIIGKLWDFKESGGDTKDEFWFADHAAGESEGPSTSSTDALSAVDVFAAIKTEIKREDPGDEGNSAERFVDVPPPADDFRSAAKVCRLCLLSGRSCRFSSEQALRLHEKTYEHKMAFRRRTARCPHCPFLGDNLVQLNEHVIDEHGGQPLPDLGRQCHVCLKLVANVTRHVELEHDDVDSYRCPICHKYFRRDMTWMRRHVPDCRNGGDRAEQMQNEHPICCHFCEKRYKTDKNLVQHVKYQHTGKHPFVCSVGGCDFSAGRRRVVEHHEAEGHRPLDELQCSFSNGKTTTVGIYTCRTCGKAFLTTYRKRMHEEQCKSKSEVRLFINLDEDGEIG